MCRIICLLKQTYKIVWKMLGFERYNSVNLYISYHLFFCLRRRRISVENRSQLSTTSESNSFFKDCSTPTESDVFIFVFVLQVFIRLRRLLNRITECISVRRNRRSIGSTTAGYIKINVQNK
jgi:hypothetical protein